MKLSHLFQLMTIVDYLLCFRIVMFKINQAFEHFGMFFISVLDFIGTECIRSVNNQINL